jgi:hypothetical protein
MFFFQQAGTNQKIPFTTKLAFVFWVILSLALLSFFAFGIFLVALMVGLVLFASNLFQKKKRPDSIPYHDSQTRPYTPPRNIKDDDDVIDI